MRKIVVDEKTGRIENIIKADDSFRLKGKLLIAHDTADLDWSYVDGELVAPEITESLEDITSRLQATVKGMKRSKIESGGFEYQGNIYQVGLEAQKDMLAVQTQFILGATSPHGGDWRTLDNKNIAMTDDELKAFFQAAFNYVNAVKKSEWKHREKIDKIDSIDKAKAYDISQYWP